MVDFPIRVVIKPQAAIRAIKQIDTALAQLEKRAKRVKVTVGTVFDDKAPNKLRNALSGLKQAFAGISVALAARSIVNAARDYENLERRVRSVSGTAKATAANLKLIRDISEETGTSLANNASTFARLSIATKTLGIGAVRTAGIVKTLNQALVIGGANASEAATTITQLGQALASGRLQGDELRSLLENAPTLAAELSKQLGITIGELREMGAAGQLTADKLVTALEGAAGDIDGQFKKLGPSFDQSVQRLNNAIVELGRSFQPMLKNLTQSLTLVTKLTKGIGNIVSIGDRLRAVQGKIADNKNLSEEGKSQDAAKNIGNRIGLFEGGESALGVETINKRIKSLSDQFKELGIRAIEIEQLRQRIDAAGVTSQVAGLAVKNLIGEVKAFGIDAQSTTKNVTDLWNTTQDYFETTEKASESTNNASAALAQQGVIQRRAARLTKNQIDQLKNEASQLQLTGAARAALQQVQRAEQTLKKASIDLTNVAVIAQLKEISALAMANEKRKESIKLQKEGDVAAARDFNSALAERSRILATLATEEDKQIERQEQLFDLMFVGGITLDEYNRILKESPLFQEDSTSQMQAFIDVLFDANKQAEQLGATFANTLVGGIDRASGALADFALSGAQDVDQLREAMANILGDIAQQILQAIIKALILKAITGTISGFGGAPTAARSGASANSGRNFYVNEGGPELFVPSSSPLSQPAAAMRATTRQSSSASRFATRQTGGAVIPGGGAPTPFTPPSAGQIVPAAQTASILNQTKNQGTVVVQAPPPEVAVAVTPTIMVGGKAFAQAISTDDDVQTEIVQVVSQNKQGLRQSGRS